MNKLSIEEENIIEIRKYTPADCAEIAQLFVETVHAVCKKDYPPEQLDAWTGHVDLERWNRSFLEHNTLIAVADGRIVGFGDIDASGYLDRLMCIKIIRGRGLQPPSATGWSGCTPFPPSRPMRLLPPGCSLKIAVIRW